MMIMAKGPLLVVCQDFQRFFSSEITELISFQASRQRGGGRGGAEKVYIYGPGRMTKMAAMPIYYN